ncbi:MAG: di-trans,poly-cis-decaprenylcistransferase [Gammaproteobacteria bacterium]|nr:di-trans,poly-cis-decaprenylcistransferase [Gammaproteobacteria bacterium]
MDGGADRSAVTPLPVADATRRWRQRLATALRRLSRLAVAPLYWWYARRLQAQVTVGTPLPHHLGVILDGNRRYARALGLSTSAGHSIGAQKVEALIEWCAKLGIPRVTLWVFSTDNHSRDEAEVMALYRLFADHARRMTVDPRIHAQRIRVRMIGDLGQLPGEVRRSFAALERSTSDYDGMQLYVAVSYGGREEIMSAVRRALKTKQRDGLTLAEATESLTTEDISAHLYAAPCPDPDFIIRTSGEVRLSGFLLWQSVYSEFYFCDVFWPEFRWLDFLRALRAYQKRQRRFGR